MNTNSNVTFLPFLSARTEAISYIMTKVEMAKHIHLQMWTLFAIWAYSIETNFDLHIKLQFFKNQFQLSLLPKIAKNHICKWKSFAISNFVIIEEMASGSIAEQERDEV